MKSVWVLLSLILLSVTATSVMAQDATPETTCTPTEWADFVPDLIEILNSISTSEDPAGDILLVEAWLETTRARCTGGVWTSEENGAGASVIGPVVFSGTLYQGTLTTEKSAIMSVTAIEGNCDFESLSVLDIAGDDPNNEDTALFKFDGCVAYFEVDGYGDPWSLTLVKLK